VVGVDGSSHARLALEVAVAEAAARGAELEVVYAWEQPMAAMYPATIPISVDEMQQYAEAVMRRMLDDVDVSALTAPPVRSVCEGSPREILLDRASSADVLVVGARGIGGFRGMFLGSVSHAVSRHAECTVLVVPPEGA
jgi:nucleotide-binding universal stress UspA family protein